MRVTDDEAHALVDSGLRHMASVPQCGLAADLLDARAEIARLRGVLVSMATDGCGCFGPDSCRDTFPDDDSQWCWPCLAARALEGCAK